MGSPSRNEILALKRLTFNRFATKSLSIALPADFRREKLELHLMTDSYIGLDQCHYIDLLNINAFLESKGAVAKKGCEALTGFRSLQEAVIDDIFDDEAAKVALAAKAGTVIGEDESAKMYAL